MKKSNNLGGLSGPPKHTGAHWTPLKRRECDEYARIVNHTLALHNAQGRQTAIQYIQGHRPWLTEYMRPIDLPASGTLLDGWRMQRQ
jgi:hypothetical protein